MNMPNSSLKTFNTIDKPDNNESTVKKSFPLAPKLPKNYGHPKSTNLKGSSTKAQFNNADNTDQSIKTTTQNDVIVEFDPLTESQRDILLPQQDNFLDSMKSNLDNKG
jgi:hypothetical protein